MRLVTFKPRIGNSIRWRVGVCVDNRIADLSVVNNLFCKTSHGSTSDYCSGSFPVTLLELLMSSEFGIAYVRRVIDWLGERWQYSCEPKGAGEERLFWNANDCDLDAPLRPGKLITVARNYHEHVAEHGLTHTGTVPSASIKATSSLSGPYDDIIRPRIEQQLDYETELAVVIGKRCKNVPQQDAYSVVVGYVVLSDIVARQVLKLERASGNQFLGKMFDSFGPLGPYLVTKDEIRDPMNLIISTKVNGQVRQLGNTKNMIWTIPQLISYFSQATLEPGDIISTGTPAGVAAGRKPNEAPWYLNPGDVIESEVEGIGILKNKVVKDDFSIINWDWKL